MKKTTNILFILLLGLFMAACQNDKPAATDRSQPVTPVAPAPTPNTPANTAVNTSGVEHYICPNGHVGSGGDAAGVCTQCSATLVHNAAYHANDPARQPQNTGTDGTSPLFQNADQAGQPQQQQQIQPPANTPQNAAGVWHYTCANGCAGGAGAKGPCSGCGAELVHNAAYHQ